MLQPAPVACDEHSVDGTRPIDTSQKVIDRNDRGRRDEDAPVSVKRQKCERTENVKMGFDAPSQQMNQQCPHQHLCDTNDMTSQNVAGPPINHGNWQARDQAAQENGGPNVNMRRTGWTRPGEWRKPQGRAHGRDPLKPKQTAEKPIGMREYRFLMLAKQVLGASRNGEDNGWIGFYF